MEPQCKKRTGFSLWVPWSYGGMNWERGETNIYSTFFGGQSYKKLGIVFRGGGDPEGLSSLGDHEGKGQH